MLLHLMLLHLFCVVGRFHSADIAGAGTTGLSGKNLSSSRPWKANINNPYPHGWVADRFRPLRPLCFYNTTGQSGGCNTLLQ